MLGGMNDEKPSRPWDDVRQLADQVRLEVHLAGMELKERWNALEPELREVEEKLSRAGDKVESLIAGQLATLATTLRKLADDMRKNVQSK
jgi:hypothetical protein